MMVQGDYHSIAKFISDVADLPRIVNIEDFTIKNQDKTDSGAQLVMNVTAKTYRYIDKSNGG